VKLMPPPTHISAPDFWQWAHSDHLSNANRGVLAEYIVGLAVGATAKPRVEWDKYDLVTPSGVSIEVKSSAHLQSWDQAKPSTIVFDIAPKTCWDAATNTYTTGKERSADVYVFCVFEEQERSKANPLDLSQWGFFVCLTADLNVWFGEQKSVRLNVLKSKLKEKGLERVGYLDISPILEQILKP
jgi:hypothetical protein